MISVTRGPGRSGGRIFNHVPLLLAAICLAGGLQADMPVNAAETGIKGTVVWGPVHGGPARLGQSEEAPLSASFHVLGSEHKVAHFKSDDKGYFEVSLPAGEYTIVPDKSTPMPFPGQQKKTVTVPEDGFAVVTLRFDTGMR
jgi:hypothetical protein